MSIRHFPRPIRSFPILYSFFRHPRHSLVSFRPFPFVIFRHLSFIRHIFVIFDIAGACLLHVNTRVMDGKLEILLGKLQLRGWELDLAAVGTQGARAGALSGWACP